jgi:hypothetical protein
MDNFGDDAVPGDGRAGCGLQMPSQASKMLVEHFYCRVLQRPPESDRSIINWIDYLQSHTVKDAVRAGIKSAEFKIRFVDNKSDEILAATLYDVLLAQAGDAAGLAYWTNQVELIGWDNAVDAFLASTEYMDNVGDDAVPGDGRAGCLEAPSDASEILVEQFYCRVLQRPAESDEAILGWARYLNDNTVKDMVRAGITSGEFKGKFVVGRSDETLAALLYDVLLAQAGDAEGLAFWTNQVGGLTGWDNAVDAFLASAEYNNASGDDAVPGDGRAGCGV